ILPSLSRPRMTPLITRSPMRHAFGIGLACLKPPIWMLLRRAVPVMTPLLPCVRSVGRFRGLEDTLQGYDVAEARVTRPAKARDRIEARGLDLAVTHETIADVKQDDLADDEPAFGLAEFEALAEAAFHRDGRSGKSWHPDLFAGDGLELEMFDLADICG